MPDTPVSTVECEPPTISLAYGTCPRGVLDMSWTRPGPAHHLARLRGRVREASGQGPRSVRAVPSACKSQVIEPGLGFGTGQGRVLTSPRAECVEEISALPLGGSSALSRLDLGQDGVEDHGAHHPAAHALDEGLRRLCPPLLLHGGVEGERAEKGAPGGGRYGGDVGRCGEMWGDAGRCGEMRGDGTVCQGTRG